MAPGVMASTLDSETTNLSSNTSGTWNFLSIIFPHCEGYGSNEQTISLCSPLEHFCHKTSNEILEFLHNEL